VDDPQIMDEDFTPQSEKKWTMKRYQKKLSNLSRVIELVNINELPEFIALAEVENKTVLEDLCKTEVLSEAKYGIVHHESNDGRGIDVGLLYRTDEFKVKHSELIPIDIAPGLSKYPPREILYVKGKLSDTEVIHIFVNHWKSRRGGTTQTEPIRIAAAKTLRLKVDEIFSKKPDAKIIICGDMNDTPENKSLSSVLDAKKSVSEIQKSGLFNLMYMKSLNGKGSYSYSGEWNMLDNLVVSHSFMKKGRGYRVSPDGGEVLFDKKILYYNSKAGDFVPSKTYGGKNYYGGYSDHLPVYFRMEKW
ncbi:MAG: endonuclease, partial [Bacteroidota bacterium]|nr:endonuclease [Bacteroidota bacterium]